MRADFRLAGWIIRPRRDCIERDGGFVHVKPKSMAVLECLSRAAGHVVTRAELFDTVWPNGEVTDDALTQCIVELRRAFGDDARHPEMIETIPKIGFRLIPRVVPLNSQQAVTTEKTPPSKSSRKSITIPGGTLSVEAYEEVLLSKKEQWESTPESILRAIEHLKKAIEIDPDYAVAWYRLAGVYLNANILLGTEGFPGVYQKSEQALARARSLEPDLPGAMA